MFRPEQICVSGFRLLLTLTSYLLQNVPQKDFVDSDSLIVVSYD